jgi:hypothetical protein
MRWFSEVAEDVPLEGRTVDKFNAAGPAVGIGSASQPAKNRTENRKADKVIVRTG